MVSKNYTNDQYNDWMVSTSIIVPFLSTKLKLTSEISTSWIPWIRNSWEIHIILKNELFVKCCEAASTEPDRARLLTAPVRASHCQIQFLSVSMDSLWIASPLNSASTDFWSELVFCGEEGGDNWSTDHWIIILIICILFTDHLSYWPLHLFYWPSHLFYWSIKW